MQTEHNRYQKLAIGFGLFLVIMWLCTILSKSIYASELPRVKTETASEGKVEHEVMVDGIVIEGGERAVTPPAGIRVEKVHVRSGDRVEEGEPLFQVDLVDLDEIIGEKELEIKTLQLRIADLKKNRELEKQRELTKQQRAGEDYEAADSESEAVLKRAQEAEANAGQALQNHQEHPVNITPEEERNQAFLAYQNWLDREKELKEQILELEKKITDMETPSPEEGNGNEEGNGGEEGNGSDDREDSVKNPPTEEEKRALEEAKKQLDLLRESLAAHEKDKVEQPDFSEEDLAAENYRRQKETLEQGKKEAEYGREDAETSRVNTMKGAQRGVEDSVFPQNADSTLEIDRLKLEQLQKQLSAYRDIKKQEGIVSAEQEGMVTELFIRAGSRIPDTASLLMTDDELPCLFKAFLDKEKKKYLNIGDIVRLKLDNSSDETELVIQYLAESDTAPGSYEVFCNLPEKTGVPGMSGRLEGKVTGEIYRCVIPAAALYSEEGRHYIYVQKEREGILGAELYAEKVSVKVLDQNEKYAALEEGVLDHESRVITSCSEVLQNGDVVRPEE